MSLSKAFDKFFYIRILSLLLLVALQRSLGDLYVPVFLALIFSHYLLALLYASGQVRTLAGRREVWWTAIPLLGIGILSVRYSLPPVPILIAAHIAISDVYTMSATYSPRLGARDVAELNALRFFLNFSVFGLALNTVKPFQIVPPLLWAACAGLLFLFFVALLWRIRRAQAGRLPWNLFFFELSGLGIASAVFFFGWKPTVQELVFYHLLTWILLPTTQFWPAKKHKMRSFAILNVICFAVFYTLNLALLKRGGSLLQVLPIFAVFHVLSSIPLSRLNPYFLRRVFYVSAEGEISR